MRVLCDACEKAAAAVICCADEAALCASCDVEVHAANKLAGKHQRLRLQSYLPSKLPRCDICQEKTAIVFCIEDRALLCRDCDEPIHAVGSFTGSHRRLLATGIHVALSSTFNNNINKDDFEPSPNVYNHMKVASSSTDLQVLLQKTHPSPSSASYPPPWVAVDDFLQLSDSDSGDYKQRDSVGFGELDWFSDIGLAAAVVPELFTGSGAGRSSTTAYLARPPPSVSLMPKEPMNKKLRLEVTAADAHYFIVPDLG